MVIVGAGTLFAIERTLADDLLASLDTRMSKQGNAVANWLTMAGHPDRLAPRLAAVTGTRITIVGADGLVQGDSREQSTVGRPIRRLRADEPPQYLVAVPADLNRVIRLAVPLGDVLDTRARMRNRLLI